MSEPGTNPPDAQLDEQAAQWFARMRGPGADAQRDAFETWLKEPANRSAYNEIAESFSLGRLMIDDRARRRRRLAAAGAALLLLTVTGTWLGLRPGAGGSPSAGLAQDGPAPATGTALFVTAAGERRPVRLRDGSLLILAAETSVSATFSDTLRRLTLERGAARFAVAREGRPFIVYAGGGSVTARGTIFDVALAPGHRVSVRLIEGVADVTLPPLKPGPAGEPRQRRLHAGEAMGFAAAPGTQAIQSSERGAPDAAAAAAAGQAQEFDHVSVAQLIALANRTSPRPIRLSDPAIGERKVSGRLRLNDTELLAERIAALFDLAVDRGSADAITLRPK